jgi:hypothetical protein
MQSLSRVTTSPRWSAGSRRMRSASADSRRSPIRSTQILPSRLTITSTTSFSAGAAAITGPMAEPG